MYLLIFGSIVFFSLHLYSAFRSRDPVRDIRVNMGPIKYRGLYSLFAGAGFLLMVWGYVLARPSQVIYGPPSWGVHINMALMLPALIALMVSYGPYGYLKRAIKHPMLISVILWSIGHLLANGELNSVILFGSFLVFCIIDRIAVAGRPQTVTAKPPSLFADIYAVGLGIILYWLILKYLHGMLFGVPVI